MGVLLALALLLAPAGAGPRADGASAEIERIDRELAAGKLREAEALLRALLAADAELRSTARGAELQLTLARVEVNLGRYHDGLEAARSALRTYEELADPDGQARAHFRIATAYDELARYDESHRHNHRALALYRQLGDRLGEAECLSMFGTSFRFLGDARTALRYHEEARRIFAELGRTTRVAFEHRHLGLVLEELQRPEQAKEHYARALAMLRGRGRSWGEADLLFQLGRLEFRGGDVAAAAPLLEEALALGRSAQNAWVEAMALLELARVRAERDELAQAESMARRGIRLLDEMGARDLVWEAFALYASLLDRGGDPAAAESAYREAVRRLEAVRSSIGRPIVRSHYTPRTRGVYEALTLLQSRWPEDAPRSRRAATSFETAERSRAQTLAEMLLDSRGPPSAAPQATDRTEIELRGKIHALRTRLTRFGHEITDRETVENELFEAEQRYDARLLELRRRDRRFEETVGAAPATVVEAARVLGDGVDLIAYQLGEQRALGWHLSRGEIELFELPGRAQIENLVALFRSLTASRDDPAGLREVARHLSARLLGPVLTRLDPGRTLVLMPDGGLFDLPFESLPIGSGEAEGERFLIERHNIFYVPSIRVLEQVRRRAAERERSAAGLDLLAFGDPVPDAEAPWPPLLHAASELRRIAALFADDRCESNTGPRASLERLREARPARILHLATHGVLDAVHPERSGLVLADGLLQVPEIFHMRLTADLAVLSGCETGRGERPGGEGILGLAQAFQFAGTQAVVASLWRVDDRSTEDLMVSFYRKLRRGVPTAQALRRTKLEWIEATPPGAFDPFPWAAFVLIGDGEQVVDVARPRDWLAPSLVAIGAVLLATAFRIARRRRPHRARASASTDRLAGGPAS